MLYRKEANSRDRKSNIEKGGGGSIVEIRKEICLKYSNVTKCLNTFVAHCSLVKSVRSLAVLFNVIRIYEQGSGAKLNISKTEAMWLGAWRSRTDQPFGLSWVPKMKILGVFFGQATEADNWQPKLKKLENHLNLWKSRSLSLVGKSLIVNTLGISKLLYLATILTVPRWVISDLNNLVWPFLWGCRMETVSRQSCYQPFLRGGLGILNFQIKADALKLASIITGAPPQAGTGLKMQTIFFFKVTL